MLGHAEQTFLLRRNTVFEEAHNVKRQLTPVCTWASMDSNRPRDVKKTNLQIAFFIWNFFRRLTLAVHEKMFPNRFLVSTE